jgi:hypothetical protein
MHCIQNWMLEKRFLDQYSSQWNTVKLQLSEVESWLRENSGDQEITQSFA